MVTGFATSQAGVEILTVLPWADDCGAVAVMQRFVGFVQRRREAMRAMSVTVWPRCLDAVVVLGSPGVGSESWADAR